MPKEVSMLIQAALDAGIEIVKCPAGKKAPRRTKTSAPRPVAMTHLDIIRRNEENGRGPAPTYAQRAKKSADKTKRLAQLREDRELHSE